MPVGAVNSAGRQVLHLVKRLREELKVNTTCGASNFSFGIPNRKGMDGTFLNMAIAAGLTSAITNPLHEQVMQAVMGANVVMGYDQQLRALAEKITANQPNRTAPTPARAVAAGVGVRPHERAG